MTDRQKPAGLRRIVRAVGYSWQWLVHTWREAAAFRQEASLAAMVVPAGICLGRTGAERALLVAPMLSVGSLGTVWLLILLGH